jgi:YYY domain-containing protein
MIIAASAALVYLSKKNRNSILSALKNPKSIRLMAIEETIFASALLYWSTMRGRMPLLENLEKPMDYGFMMSLMRTDFLPAKDMWYSQGSINYYYYGQYLYTFITKLTGMQPVITYNLSLAATFALTLSLAFALCYLLLSYAKKRGTGLYKFAPVTGGAVGAFLVTLGGNSHSFFYGEGHPGNVVLQFLQDKGWLAWMLPSGTFSAGDADVQGINITDFWFANSTRYIGYNPTTHDKTIHEFPYYSFLVADLHAHLINLAFVLLFLALLAVLLHSTKMKAAARNFFRVDSLLIRSNDKQWLHKEMGASLHLLKTTLMQPIFLLCSLLLGTFMMCNFWDFAIYMVVISMALLIINLRGFGKLGSWETIPVFLFQIIVIFIPFLFLSNPFLAVAGFAVSAAICFALLLLTADAFTVTGAQLSLLFLISHAVTLPFNANFEPMAKSLSLCLTHTPLFQLLILWGTHLFIGLLFMIYIIRRRFAEKNDINASAARSRGKISQFLAGMNPMDLFVCGLFICGVIFITLPEFVYVVDIYSGDYKRANTMFKFTYQAFIMLSVVAGYAVVRMAMTKKRYSRIDRRWTFVAVIMALSLMIPAYYPFTATRQYYKNFDIYDGLDGLDGLSDHDRQAAISWINGNIKGQPVMLESYGNSYTNYCQISAYTGLPTVVGWQTHEWLWRTSKKVTDGYSEIVKPRQADVRMMYEFTDETAARALFKKYEVEYIIVGLLERTNFQNINEEMLKSLGSVIFQNEGLYIIHIVDDGG